jgi:biotin carboxylase
VKGITSGGGERVRISRTEDELRQAVADLARPGEELPSVQKFIDGPTFVVGGLFDDGNPLRLFAFEKIDLFPPGIGPSTRLRAVSYPALLDAGLRALKAVRWTGLGSAEFMGDADGVFHFVEVNPRVWGSAPLAVAAGVDLWAPLADLLAGRSVEPDLSYSPDFTATWFPPRLMAKIQRGTLGELATVASDLDAWRAAPWREPGLVAWYAWGLAAQWAAARRADNEVADREGPLP